MSSNGKVYFAATSHIFREHICGWLGSVHNWYVLEHAWIDAPCQCSCKANILEAVNDSDKNSIWRNWRILMKKKIVLKMKPILTAFSGIRTPLGMVLHRGQWLLSRTCHYILNCIQHLVRNRSLQIMKINALAKVRQTVRNSSGKLQPRKELKLIVLSVTELRLYECYYQNNSWSLSPCDAWPSDVACTRSLSFWQCSFKKNWQRFNTVFNAIEHHSSNKIQ